MLLPTEAQPLLAAFLPHFSHPTYTRFVVLTAGALSLLVADATHAQAVDGLTLTQVHALAVQDATQAHSAESVALGQVHVLTVADARHTHTADTVTLSGLDLNPVTATVQDAGHTATVEDAGHTATARDAGHTATAREMT